MSNSISLSIQFNSIQSLFQTANGHQCLHGPCIDKSCHRTVHKIPFFLTQFSPQAISNLANAYSKAGMTDDDALMGHLASAALNLPPEAFSPQVVGPASTAMHKTWWLVFGVWSLMSGGLGRGVSGASIHGVVSVF